MSADEMQARRGSAADRAMTLATGLPLPDEEEEFCTAGSTGQLCGCHERLLRLQADGRVVGGAA